MRFRGLGCACIAALMTAACAQVVAPLAPGSPNEPRVSWVIRSGPRGGNEPDICRSDRQQPCVLTASTSSRPMSVAVSVYMYPAGAATEYSGAFQATFIQAAGGAGYEAKVDYAVELADLPTATTASGLVTSTAGTHEFRIALFAEVPGRMDPHQFEDRIPVRVSGGGASTPGQ
jgi:hypothetical protein